MLAVGCSIIMLAILLVENIWLADLFEYTMIFISMIAGNLISLFSSDSYQIAYDAVYASLQTETFLLVFHIIISLLSTIIPYTIFARLSHIKMTEVFSVITEVPKMFWLYIPFTIGAGFLVNLAVLLIFGDLFAVFREPSGEAWMPSTALGIFLYYVMVAFVPAIFEEWAFRGLILRSLLPYGKGFALISSSIVFGMMHIDPPQVIFATAFGLLAGFIYIKTGSIWYGALIHLINNAFSVTGGFATYFRGENSIDVILIGIITILMLIAAVVGIAYFTSTGYFKTRVMHGIKPPDAPKLCKKQYFQLTFANGATIVFICLYIFVLLVEYFPAITDAIFNFS